MPTFFPYARIEQVPLEDVRQAVLEVLGKWGFIGAFRVDNGRPFGDPTRQSLTPLALWLMAHGISVRHNPARSPKSNAKVERSQGTTGRWVDPPSCKDIGELKKRLKYAVLVQREKLPTKSCNGITRAAAHPRLYENRRKFDPTDFDMQRVFDHLVGGKWHRKVSVGGHTAMFGKTCQVGFRHRRKDVIVKFNNESISWDFYDEDLSLLNSIKADNLNADNIQRLNYCQ